MNPVFILPLLIAVAILGFFIWLGMSRGAKQPTLEERLSSFAERPRSLDEMELELPFSERVIKPLTAGMIRFLGNISPSKGAERTRIKLAQAGNPNNMQVTEFMGVRVVAAVGLCLLGTRLSIFVFRVPITNVLMFGAVGLGLGYMAPV